MKFLLMLLVLFAISDFTFLAGRQNSGAASIEMPALFSDNMVLQQKTEAAFWGKANPGDQIVITASWGATAKSKVNSDGSWMTKIKTTKAGGPYDVKIKIGDSTIVYKNILLGEVWLCSGQSNMEMPLQGWPPQAVVKNSAEEIQNANYPEIRMFTVARAFSAQPEFNFKGSWIESSPQTAGNFSATAYFFGRELYQKLKVPIGLINSSWGGTKIQSWIGAKSLEQFPDYKDFVSKLDSAAGDAKKLYAWIKSHPSIDVTKKDPNEEWKNLEFNDSLCAKQDFNDASWKEMKLPVYWESTEVGDFDGVVWFRKKINIPSTWLSKDLVLKLGPIDDMDRTYVNGTQVGATEEVGFWSTPRIYSIPKEIIKDSVLTIAVRVVDNGGGGGLWGSNVKMQIQLQQDSTQSIPLEGDWKYLPVAEYLNGAFYTYGIADQEFFNRPKSSISLGPNTPTMLYNGMIAPLIPYSIRGAIWYQGEANVDIPEEYNNYKTFFEMLIKNWRSDWKEGSFPFYFVQIAPWSYGDNSKSYVVRNAQRQTLSVPNTGMAVTLDIGDIENIHPADKQDVGHRLALWALAKNYHQKTFYSGPLYKSMKTEKDKIILSFDYANKGLVFKPLNGETNFLIAGADKKFVKASVKVKGTKLIVSSDEVKNPAAVRYCWTNTAQATLFNKDGLPASTFKTDDWKE